MHQNPAEERIYTEFGYGNPTWISTEVEYPDGTETRQKGLVRMDKITEMYVRFWFGYTVYVLSSRNGFNTHTKPRKALKMLLGIGGTRAALAHGK